MAWAAMDSGGNETEIGGIGLGFRRAREVLGDEGSLEAAVFG